MIKKIILFIILSLTPVISYAYCNNFEANSFGTSNYNGSYTFNSIHNGLPSYDNGNGAFVYFQLSNNWLMSGTLGADEGHMYYGAGNNTTSPDTVTFNVSGGSSPAGSFVCTDTPLPESVIISPQTGGYATDVTLECSTYPCSLAVVGSTPLTSGALDINELNGPYPFWNLVSGNDPTSLPEGNYYIVVADKVSCSGDVAQAFIDPTVLENMPNISDFRSDSCYISDTYYTISGTGGLSDLIGTDKATFLATVGFSFDDLTTWSGDMIKMILGNGLGVFSNLMPWIIAIMVFMGILGLIWGGFRFFRH